MTKEQLETRDKIYYQLWEDYKSRWNMKQLAEIVNCPLPTFYERVRKQREFKKGEHNEKKEMSKM